MSEDGQSRRNRSPILNKLSDFANVFKAFIGVNYLTLPFAFKESGMILGIIGLFIIAFITDHCCLLIVKCKRAAIDKIIDSATCQDVFEDSQGITRAEKKLQERRVLLENTMTYGDIGRLSMGRWGNYIVNAALILTQFSFCINYFIFMGDTITRMFPSKNETQQHSGNSSSSLLTTTKQAKHDSAPNVIFLMLIPFPFFVLQTYVRNIRSLGPLSIIANVCVFLGFFSILGYIINGLDLGNIHKIELWKFSTFPIFFGQLISSYEGIGTIIPIEASMKENRPNFPMYLHGAIFGFSLILGTFGIFGYLHYMDDVEQLISDNLEYGTLSIIVQITLCVGILFTYPLQMFPVVEIIENFLFKETKARGTLVSSLNTEYRDLLQDSRNVQCASNDAMSIDNEQRSFKDDTGDGNNGEELLSNIEQSNLVLITKPRCGCDMGWLTWKRNIVRTVLVVLSFGMGYLGRNYFAYISALSGSIGSSVLAFILPCCFHLIIKRNVLPIFIVAKDILLILFGIIAGLVGFITTLIKIIKL